MAKAPSEKHLEDWIVANPSAFGRDDDGDLLRPFKRQLSLPSGRLDLLFQTNYEGGLVVMELKQGCLKYEDLHQVLKYVHDLKMIWFHAISTLPDPRRINARYQRIEPLIQAYLVGHKTDDLLCRSAYAVGVGIFTYDYTENGYAIYENPGSGTSYNTWFDFARGSLGEAMREAYKAELFAEYNDEEIQRMIAER